MNGNIILIFDNHFDDCTLQAIPAGVSTLPVENLKKVSRAAIFRSTVTDTQEILFTRNTFKVFAGFAMTNHNIPTTATMRLQLWDGESQTGNLVYDSGLFGATESVGWGDFMWGEEWGASVFSSWSLYHTQLYFDPVYAKSGKITITNPVASIMDIGRVYLGSTFQPKYNCDWGAAMAWNEETTQTRTEGGTVRSDPKTPYRSITLALPHLSTEDRLVFGDLRRIIGLRKDFFISVYPNGSGKIKAEHSFGCKFSDMPQMTHTSPNNFSHAITITET